MKERGIDLSLSTWRGLAAPRGTPPEVLTVLGDATRKIAAEPSLKEALDRLSMGQAYADAEGFRSMMKAQNDYFRQLVPKLNIKV
jgi:tripartite-type tricarboxylate transporter receptor subunit TctC